MVKTLGEKGWLLVGGKDILLEVTLDDEKNTNHTLAHECVCEK